MLTRSQEVQSTFLPERKKALLLGRLITNICSTELFENVKKKMVPYFFSPEDIQSIKAWIACLSKSNLSFGCNCQFCQRSCGLEMLLQCQIAKRRKYLPRFASICWTSYILKLQLSPPYMLLAANVALVVNNVSYLYLLILARVFAATLSPSQYQK